MDFSEKIILWLQWTQMVKHQLKYVKYSLHLPIYPSSMRMRSTELLSAYLGILEHIDILQHWHWQCLCFHRVYRKNMKYVKILNIFGISKTGKHLRTFTILHFWPCYGLCFDLKLSKCLTRLSEYVPSTKPNISHSG